jgi:uncharacterized membrane protein YkoI
MPHRNSHSGISMLGALALAIAAGAVTLIADSVAGNPARRPISRESARTTAIARFPGASVKSEQLETEGGVQIYTFGLQAPNRRGIDEVEIGAVDGRLVSWKYEIPPAGRSEAAAVVGARRRR